MDRAILQQAEAIAREAIQQAGEWARDKFGRGIIVEEKDRFGDVVTEVDHQAEAILLEAVQRAFPDHQIHSEEAGHLGPKSDWLWLIDPLDGTNNYAIGLPVFAHSMTLLYRREPVLGVVYEPLVNRMYICQAGQGATCNGRPIQVRRAADLHRANIGWIQGHRVQQESRAVRLRQHIDMSCKRMLRLWAPTIQWCMLACGQLDGIVLYNSEGDDLYSGLLMVKEAGGVVVDFNGKPFTGMNSEPYLIACHPDNQQVMLQLVHDGLQK
ncbi:inositol monophosphatase [Xylanibacillus composti]|uniref:Inositol monophosphatase n=1 Tax=Xylanibacillus composti TaxID=1572762 RepID=A0A8J4H279_9BACL|nr:inositol monophosphatase family protein [Xylanibacillus composti]GIQ69598.1 inositol monophosphatase [Xylanibacillus composti]